MVDMIDDGRPGIDSRSAMHFYGKDHPEYPKRFI